MNRREVIRLLGVATASAMCGCSSIIGLFERPKPEASSEAEPVSDIGEVHAHNTGHPNRVRPEEITSEFLNDVRAKSIYFDQDFPDDIRLSREEMEIVESLVKKLRYAQRTVGYGNFNILGFDEFVRITGFSSQSITGEEKAFLEMIFFTDASIYGFQGEKVISRMTDIIPSDRLLKVPYTGHFLRKGRSLEIYNRIIKDVGDSLLLTSGVRGVVKQYHLFFEKCLETKGNISKASRSLAPPGYSFHGEGDFDIGKRGYGLKNFTDEFAATEEFKRLVGLGYAEIRYSQENQLGVRFEPWHIKVHSEA